QKILQKPRSLHGQKALRMKLHAMQRPTPMPHAHDLVFVGPGRDHEIGVRERFAADHQTMVARGLKGIGQTLKDTLTVMMNERSFAVHHAIIAHHLAAEDMADALMPEAN